MTTRSKIILIGSLVLLGLLGLIITSVLTNKSPVPSPEDTNTSEQKPSDNTSQEEDGHDQEGPVYSQEDQNAMIRNAEQAAEAYVAQPSGETTEARQARLKQFFAPSSTAFAAPVPNPTAGYYTADITPIETSWYPTEKTGVIGVLVYLKVEVNLPMDNKVENQTWKLELVPVNGGWLTSTITKSDLPYIEATNS